MRIGGGENARTADDNGEGGGDDEDRKAREVEKSRAALMDLLARHKVNFNFNIIN